MGAHDISLICCSCYLLSPLALLPTRQYYSCIPSHIAQAPWCSSSSLIQRLLATMTTKTPRITLNHPSIKSPQDNTVTTAAIPATATGWDTFRCEIRQEVLKQDLTSLLQVPTSITNTHSRSGEGKPRRLTMISKNSNQARQPMVDWSCVWLICKYEERRYATMRSSAELGPDEEGGHLARADVDGTSNGSDSFSGHSAQPLVRLWSRNLGRDRPKVEVT